MRRPPLYPLVALAAIIGCKSPTPPAGPPVPEGPPTPEALALATTSQGFALDLYGKVAAKPGNVSVSPFSAHTALAMTATGARGDTLAEMRRALHMPDDEAAARGFRDLLPRLTGGGQGYEVRTANAVWAQAGYPWRPEFPGRVADTFGAGFREANFGNPEAERARINAWAEQETNGRIKDLLAEGKLTTNHRMVLVNAVYFKGQWANAFDPKRTHPAPFTRADGTKVNVPMMTRKGGFRLLWVAPAGDAPGLSVADIAYRGGQVSMLIVLPEKPDGLPAVEKRLSPDLLTGWLAAATETEKADLVLPKFRLEKDYDLIPALQALGISKAFDPFQADFFGMHSGRDQLFVNPVVQKTFLDVNEEGTEAAAATAVGMQLMSATFPFQADHPFLFLIRHVPTGTILFIGRYAGP